MGCWRTQVKATSVRKRALTLSPEYISRGIVAEKHNYYSGEAMSTNLFNQQSGEATRLLPTDAQPTDNSPCQINKPKCTRKKWLITGATAVIAIIIVVVTCVLVLPKKKKTTEDKASSLVDEDDRTRLPDPEFPPPPSKNNVLKRFKGNGAVCAGCTICAEIGKSILKRNGSAVDAAIATSICGGMTNMQYIGIGGATIMTIYDQATRKAYFLNARERAPLAAHPDMFVNQEKTASYKGPLAIAVPGEIQAFAMAHKRFGRLPWAELFKDSIKLCRNGWKLSQTQHDDLSRIKPKILEEPTLRSIFVDESTQDLKPAETIVRPSKLCETFETLAKKGAHEFYNGTLAQMMVADLQKQKSILTLEDFSGYKATWEEPLTTELVGGLKVYTGGPPSSGALLIFALNILNEYNFTADSLKGVNNEITTYHVIIEAFKYAFAMRTAMDDPEYINMTNFVEKLTSKDFARMVKSKIHNDKTWNDPKHYGAEDELHEDHGTLHMSIIAPDGDAVSITGTQNTYFGSGVVSQSTGVLFNSGMDDFSIPSVINFFGLPGNNKTNVIRPGKRPVSSMVPTIIVGPDNRVKMVIGAAGGTKILSATAFVSYFTSLVIARYLWMNNTIKEAVDASRPHHQLFPMKMEYQYGITRPVIQGLESLGHTTSRYRNRGSAVCALVQTPDSVEGVADNRRSGDVCGI